MPLDQTEHAQLRRFTTTACQTAQGAVPESPSRFEVNHSSYASVPYMIQHPNPQYPQDVSMAGIQALRYRIKVFESDTRR